MHTAKVPHISYMHMIRRSFETEEARVSRVKSGDRRDGKANRFLQTVLHVAPCLEGTIARK